jgi:hypothetical protein
LYVGMFPVARDVLSLMCVCGSYGLSSPGLLKGLMLLRAWLVQDFYTVAPNLIKPTHSLLFLAPIGPFVMRGRSLEKPQRRIEQRAVKWVLGFGGSVLDRRQ